MSPRLRRSTNGTRAPLPTSAADVLLVTAWSAKVATAFLATVSCSGLLDGLV